STANVDFDEFAAFLERDLAGFDRGKRFADNFAADLRYFYESKQCQLQVWVGGSGKDKTDRALKTLDLLGTDRYAGVFFPHRIFGHEHIDRLTDLFNEFADPSRYPDNSVIFLEDAEMVFDPAAQSIDAKTHRVLVKKLNAIRSSRKILFVLIGSFSTRQRPLTAPEKNEIFGEDLAPLVMERIFYPPEIYAFMSAVLPAYEAQDIQIDEDGLLALLQYCVKRGVGKEGFFVCLRELHHFFDSRPTKTFTKEEVRSYLDKAERKVS
ncbi:MAG TPA: hypothetical protein PL182_04525, partial [Pseudobdellovibrionaceae bacterium]|nr:hypothetical protein [Pseudobdellovibrionaceae bacterium]